MKKLKNLSLYNYLIVITAFISIISLIRVNNIKYEILNNNIVGTIIEYKVKNDKLNLIIKINNKKIKCNYYNLNNNKYIKYGSIINANIEETSISNNTIPNTFNYKKYLKSINIYNTCNIKELKGIKQSSNIIYKIKNNITERIIKYDTKGYLQTFILSNKSFLDENIYNNYKSLGIIHLFSISGMHISFLALIILTILNKIKISKFNNIIVFIFLLFYMIITNYCPSIVRSVVFYILMNLNKILDLKIENKSIILISINIILFINPNFVINIGFLYSSIISFALIRFKNIFNKSYFINLILISILSLLVSLPLTININYEINILSIISNLIFVPLVTFIIYPLSLISFLFPCFYFIFDIFINLLETISFFLNKINILKINIPYLNIYIIFIYYIILYLLLTKNKKYIVILIFLLLINKYSYLINNNYYVYFLDVNQGDMSLIKYKNECVIIDTGPLNEYTQNNILLFIKSLGINKIDTIIITHGDSDHIGNTIFLVNNIKIKKVILNNGIYNNLEKELIKKLKLKKIKYYKNIKELSIKKNKLKFLNTNIYDNENDNSNVIYFKHNNYKFLFMGDASLKREKDIIDKYDLHNIDFFKVGHHGSNTSTSEYFINKIKPNNCIISVGKNNMYGHPKQSVLNILKKCNIYRTDKSGSIELKYKNNEFNVKTYFP